MGVKKRRGVHDDETKQDGVRRGTPGDQSFREPAEDSPVGSVRRSSQEALGLLGVADGSPVAAGLFGPHPGRSVECAFFRAFQYPRDRTEKNVFVREVVGAGRRHRSLRTAGRAGEPSEERGGRQRGRGAGQRFQSRPPSPRSSGASGGPACSSTDWATKSWAASPTVCNT